MVRLETSRCRLRPWPWYCPQSGGAGIVGEGYGHAVGVVAGQHVAVGIFNGEGGREGPILGHAARWLGRNDDGRRRPGTTLKLAVGTLARLAPLTPGCSRGRPCSATALRSWPRRRLTGTVNVLPPRVLPPGLFCSKLTVMLPVKARVLLVADVHRGGEPERAAERCRAGRAGDITSAVRIALA